MRGDTDILIEENSAKRQRTDPAWQIWPCWVTLPLLGPRSDSGMQSPGRPLPQETGGCDTQVPVWREICHKQKEKRIPTLSGKIFSRYFCLPTITPPSLQGSVCEVWSLIETLANHLSDVNSSNADFTSCGLGPDAWFYDNKQMISFRELWDTICRYTFPSFPRICLWPQVTLRPDPPRRGRQPGP